MDGVGGIPKGSFMIGEPSIDVFIHIIRHNNPKKKGIHQYIYRITSMFKYGFCALIIDPDAVFVRAIFLMIRISSTVGDSLLTQDWYSHFSSFHMDILGSDVCRFTILTDEAFKPLVPLFLY